MTRHILVSAALVAASFPALPATAGSAAALQSTVGSRNCPQSEARSTRRSVISGLGSLGRRFVGSNPVSRTVESVIPAQSMLTDAFLDMLDCDEQQKAARATDEVTTRAETQGVGTTAAWRSESRPGVSGTSTVTEVDTPGAAGRRCMTVTDVVIIDGEETSMPKRVCRTPPSTRYARV